MYFVRSVEKNVIESVSKQNSQIISTGGGAVLNKSSALALKETGLLVFIEVTSETVVERLKNDTTRPMATEKTTRKMGLITLETSI